MNQQHESSGSERGARFRINVALIGFLIVIGYFLITEHKAHLSGVLSYLPFLLLLACPLLHFFMHGSHGGHGDGEKRSGDDAPRGDG